MSSYIFRGIDAPLWDQVKAKAKAEGVPVKVLVEHLLKAWVTPDAPDAFLRWIAERASIDENPWGITKHQSLLWEAYSAGTINVLAIRK